MCVPSVQAYTILCKDNINGWGTKLKTKIKLGNNPSYLFKHR